MFESLFFVFLWPRPASAKLILGPSGTITPFVVSVTPPAGEVRERLRDVVGRLQSVASRMRGVTQDTRSYAQTLARERGVDVGAVDRGLTRIEDQLSRADAQMVALSQVTVELDTGTSDHSILSNSRAQFRRIRTTLFSARDLLRDVLGDLRILDQQQTTPTPS